MTRTELELKLNRDRAWLLETWAAFSSEDLLRGITVSRHDANFRWRALDHLTHLAGIEAVFNRIIRRHLAGEADPIGLAQSADGTRLSHEEIMARVHAMNDAFVLQHHGKSFNEVVALGQQVRAETLSLLAELRDAQLDEKVPGAPWADGTIGGIIGVNGEHARQHYGWVTAGLAKEQTASEE